ncbi:Serine/threonine-protein kinase PrkC [Solibacillus isronensis B3W22]|uniref:Serine/threonine-protein kinase PrkC n=1 Tax=Solibacillus isronensis B3W22 TaxID=1224748 RepID=K1KRY2_9BACL|nr:Stk1 family PASTA domain-containing Ser/Thr kinase [Solibacillus isronensis]AMO84636.1 serine/threonine protein kinase [Solibacillus silvestris]EKB46925.1 Serine/threonine-protein kinase PrkC [Solibacillus isronensis B3W22]
MLVGKHISGRYKILKLIGGGGMSNVYLAHDIILSRDVAIKILRYDLSNEEELHRRFQREALSATSLTNPNIVSIYDVGEDGDMHYIVMEYIKGKTLKQYIQEFSPLSAARSAHIMKQLTSAIAHAHENGIIHRDIKPQNILMDEEGNVKITDFGIATSLGATSFTQTNSVIGTVHYLSPEQARGGVATMKSDIYALGIVFYELLTGELPFSGESAVSIALKHLQAETPSVREFDASIPQSVENIVLKATAKDQNHRYSNAEEMEEDLNTCLSLQRVNEPKFMPPVDNGATKLMPIIKDPKPVPVPVQEPSTGITEQTVRIDSKPPAEEEPKPLKPKKKKKKWPLIVGLLVLLAIGAVVAAVLLTPNRVVIEDVTDMTVEEAIRILEEQGFVIGEQEERNNEEIESGNIIETNPQAGRERDKGTTVDLIVSIGKELTKMEDFVGKQRDEVIDELEEYNSYDFREEYSSEHAAGEIIGQTPEAGEEIHVNETDVVLTVSRGQEQVTVRDLMAFNDANRSEYEKSSGFKVNVTGEEYSDKPAGEVISQTPKAGTKLEKGGTINVVISKGPKAKQEKFYTKTIEIPYEPFEEGIEQEVSIYIQDKTRTMAEPVEKLTINEDTLYTIKLVIVEGDKAAYQIVRDNNVIENKTITYEELAE